MRRVKINKMINKLEDNRLKEVINSLIEQQCTDTRKFYTKMNSNSQCKKSISIVKTEEEGITKIHTLKDGVIESIKYFCKNLF